MTHAALPRVIASGGRTLLLFFGMATFFLFYCEEL
jgi:hypothetical protein